MLFPIVALVGKYHDTGIAAPLLALAHMMRATGRKVLFEKDTAINIGVRDFPVASVAEIGAEASLAVVMGGDGTMLGLARLLAPYGVPLVGINHGRVGFITDIPLDRSVQALSDVIEGNFSSDERLLLEGKVFRGDQELFSGPALNDVVLSRASKGGMIEINVHVDGEFMSQQRADGLIIATPTGSTAYALSSNGPILHPSLRGVVLVPVAPQALSNRPITLPDTCTIDITIIRCAGPSEGGASVHFDMQSFSSLQAGDHIVVRRADHTIRFLHPAGYSYFSTLRRKLHWNQNPSDPTSSLDS